MQSDSKITGPGARFLALDGAELPGTEASQLVILGDIVDRIDYDNKAREASPLCKHFDLIGGTGMGGIFAIFFAVFRMTVEEALEAYTSIDERVFQSMAWKNSESTEVQRLLEATLEQIGQDHKIDISQSLLSNDPESCKAFVCTANQGNRAFPRLLRTYRVRNNNGPKCSIRGALIAAIAGCPGIDPIKLGRPSEDFVNAIERFGNPIFQVQEEGFAAFGPTTAVSCLVNIGAGYPGLLSLPSSGDLRLKSLEALARDCEGKAEDLARRCGHIDNFFHRLSVMHGLDERSNNRTIPLPVATHTSQYLHQTRVDVQIDRLVVGLRERSPKVSLQRLNRISTSDIMPKSDLILPARRVDKGLPTIIDESLTRRGDVDEGLKESHPNRVDNTASFDDHNDSDLLSLRRLSVIWTGINNKVEGTYSKRLPKQSLVGDLVDRLAKRVELTPGGTGRIRMFEIAKDGRMRKEFTGAETIDNLLNPVALYAEEVPREEVEKDGLFEQVIAVFHFFEEPWRTHGVPFKFIVKLDERFADTKKRLQARIGVSDKDFINFRFALSLGSKPYSPYYIKDEDILFDSCLGQDDALGLDHPCKESSEMQSDVESMELAMSDEDSRLKELTKLTSENSQLRLENEQLYHEIDLLKQKTEEIERGCKGRMQQMEEDYELAFQHITGIEDLTMLRQTRDEITKLRNDKSTFQTELDSARANQVNIRSPEPSTSTTKVSKSRGATGVTTPMVPTNPATDEATFQFGLSPEQKLLFGIPSPNPDYYDA